MNSNSSRAASSGEFELKQAILEDEDKDVFHKMGRVHHGRAINPCIADDAVLLFHKNNTEFSYLILGCKDTIDKTPKKREEEFKGQSALTTKARRIGHLAGGTFGKKLLTI